jgi:uncharacterized repeat protein (TIGR01451 family)
MSKVVVKVMAGVCLLGGLSQGAKAATADGTLITNLATATFSTATGAQVTVSYTATATVLVQNPCVSLLKVPDVTVQAAGGTVTYTLWVVNCSPIMSAFNITVTDKLPDNVSYDAARGNWNGGSGGTWTSSDSPSGLAGSYVAVPPTAGQTTPLYLRFVLDLLGASKSAMIRYSVVIL